jgi:Kdo2-lipid IVA lauroyltransferase/acyltransferase
VIFLASHYGNWEYGILAMPQYLKHKLVSLYMPMSNKFTENYGINVRQRFGMNMVKVQETRNVFENKGEKPIGVIMAADQSPSNIERAIWTDFLNQKTACLHGPEAYAKKTGMPLLYFSVSKTKRGYYSVKIETLVENPETEKPDSITKKYMQRVERDILSQPEFWLWSHRRWKHKSN